ncbi:hypothetical protein SAMN04488040_0953 [Sulfitobacter marinus]|uniref:Uncharacterized protein n=1 Tax=Sulfitobacter marinus TaxID=394264 RepID=A0A1I6QUR4_9RHOB|nr:hypothetical protein SAMN04488040_0953 [Sulfitobacter marinus]
MDRCGAVSSLTSTAKRRATGPRRQAAARLIIAQAGRLLVLKAGITGYVRSYPMKKVNIV